MKRSDKLIRVVQFLVGLLVLLALPAKQAQAQAPAVYGVFFYSPTCPHCHAVITNHWPAIQEEFGEQLQVLFIDVSTPDGSQVMRTAVQAMNIPSNGVPMLIIGRQVLVGEFDIPEHAPDIIRTGLRSGGVDYPPIPHIDAIFAAALARSSSALSGAAQETLYVDPADAVAVVVLSGLVVGAGAMVYAGWQCIARKNRQPIAMISGMLGRRMALIGAVIGIGLAGSLVIGSFEDAATLLISGTTLIMLAILAYHLFRSASKPQLAGWLTLLAVFAGLLVAGYLAYIETTLAEATCGVIGDCNAVQQSTYAYIAGIPIAIIGLFGYLVILALWLANRVTNRPWLDATIFVAMLLGTAMSIYLTFLEPFVIRASCAWCLTSAVVTGVLLWMTAPAGWTAVLPAVRPDERDSAS